MTEDDGDPQFGTRGDDLLTALAALANPQRLRILAALSEGRNYVSQLARDLEMNRPLLHMHLKRLEAAGLVTGELELSSDGQAMRYFQISDFALCLTPETVAEAARTLGQARETDATGRENEQ